MKRFLFLACAAMTVCVNGAAKAGFEWVPPTQTDNSQQMPVFAQPATTALDPLPSAQPVVAMEEEPAVTGMVPMPPAPQPVPEKEEMASNDEWQDSEQTAAPAQVANVAPRDLTPSAPAKTPRAPSDVVEGFGRDVPLTIATRQMVPSDFTVQYGRGVDPNMAVSWKGGRSWKVALADALAEKNLKATIVADSVMIEDTAPEQKLKAEPLAPAIVADPAPLPPVQETMVPEPPVEMAAIAMPEPMPAAAPTGPVKQMWVAPQASTLRSVLGDWCKEAGVQLQWSAQYDYPLMSEAQISGTFEDAVETLLDGLVDAQPRPVARLHPNEPNGPAILVVETRQILE